MHLNSSSKNHNTTQIPNLYAAEDKLILCGKADDWTISSASSPSSETDEIMPTDVEILYPVFHNNLSL